MNIYIYIYIYIYIIFYQLNNQSGINTGKPALIRNKDIKAFKKKGKYSSFQESNWNLFDTQRAAIKKKKKSAKRATGPKERQFAMASPVIIPKSNVKITRSHENI